MAGAEFDCGPGLDVEAVHRLTGKVRSGTGRGAVNDRPRQRSLGQDVLGIGACGAAENNRDEGNQQETCRSARSSAERGPRAHQVEVAIARVQGILLDHFSRMRLVLPDFFGGRRPPKKVFPSLRRHSLRGGKSGPSEGKRIESGLPHMVKSIFRIGVGC